MTERKLANGKLLRLVEGDITRVAVDAIVNAANSALAGGGGVDGAIHRSGGPELMAELDEIRPKIGRCPAGKAVATSAGRLPARYVFHAVGPIYGGGTQGEPEQLASCYTTCLNMAMERGVKTISFPAISTGVYGYPREKAAEIALETVIRHLAEVESDIESVTFVLFGAGALNTYLESRVWKSLE